MRLSGDTMGTTWSAVLAPPVFVDAEELSALLQAELDRVNRVMSTYDPNSSLSLANRAAVGEWSAVPEELLRLVRAGQAITERSGGAFDVSVGPLVNLWGFGPDGEPETVPDDAAIAAAFEAMGQVELRDQPPAMRRLHERAYVDLSAIAKGHGVDRMADLLDRQGIEHYLVEIGGELRARGQSPRGSDWRIGIERPADGERTVQQAVNLKDGALATSGDYRNYIERDGVRYAHTIDARNGRPVAHRLASVSVFAADTATADGWATALMVLGETDGPALAEAEGIAAYFLFKVDDGFDSRHTPGFDPLLGE